MNAVSEILEARQPLRVRDVAAEVLAVLRLAFTLRLDARQVLGRDATIALLGAIALLVWAVLGYVDIHGRRSSSLRVWRNWPRWRPPHSRWRGWWRVSAGRNFRCVTHCGWWPDTCRQSPPRVGCSLSRCLTRGSYAIAAFAGIHAALYFFFGLRGLGARPPWLPFAAFALVTSVLIALAALKLDFALWSRA